MSADPFAGLEPARVWKHFAAMTRLARPSGQEEKVAAHVEAWAAEQGFEVKHDATGNLCVHVPASPGRESAPAVAIQGHLDMVCERDSDSPNDAEVGRLEVVRDGDWIRAVGTTLGADNGIGVAAGMAAAEDPEVLHGPLDLLMTIDEETGMTGAIGLDPSILRARIMLNLDSEEDGVLFAGCAGGCDTKMALGGPREDPGGASAWRITVAGLKGGHSGLDINCNRLNSIRALARVLGRIAGETSLRVVALSGGSKRNAIPRESEAVIVVDPAAESLVRQAVEGVGADLREQYRGLDDGLSVELTAASAAPAFSVDLSRRLVDLLQAIPSGVVAMSQDTPGLVETSTNLGVVTTDGDCVNTVSCSRSSNAPALAEVLAGLRAVGRLAGAEVHEHGGYPGWKPNLDSPVLKVTREASARLFGVEPEVTAIHAGLECGLIGERVPGMDMVSFGPEIRGAHAPGERVQISSVQKFWNLLTAVLDDLSRV